jgi:hypothetical protein
VIADKSRVLDGRAWAGQLLQWLELFPEADAKPDTAAQTAPLLSFSQWCCLPLVVLAVGGDILVQFLR